jgi:hypothetical protein
VKITHTRLFPHSPSPRRSKGIFGVSITKFETAIEPDSSGNCSVAVDAVCCALVSIQFLQLQRTKGAMSSLYRCSSSVSSRRLYPTARRYGNCPTERGTASVPFPAAPYRSHSTAAWVTNEATMFSASRIVAAAYESTMKQTESSSNRSSLEVVVASALAFATTAGLVYLFPSTTSSSQRSGGGDPGGGGAGGGCGGGGGENGPYATMAFAATFDETFEPQQKAEVAASPAKATEKDTERPYDVSSYRPYMMHWVWT